MTTVSKRCFAVEISAEGFFGYLLGVAVLSLERRVTPVVNGRGEVAD